MAVARNWEVLITRGIVSAAKTVIIEPPKFKDPKQFAWLKSAVWTRAKVKVNE